MSCLYTRRHTYAHLSEARFGSSGSSKARDQTFVAPPNSKSISCQHYFSFTLNIISSIVKHYRQPTTATRFFCPTTNLRTKAEVTSVAHRLAVPFTAITLSVMATEWTTDIVDNVSYRALKCSATPRANQI